MGSTCSVLSGTSPTTSHPDRSSNSSKEDKEKPILSKSAPSSSNLQPIVMKPISSSGSFRSDKSTLSSSKSLEFDPVLYAEKEIEKRQKDPRTSNLRNSLQTFKFPPEPPSIASNEM